jgi:hypothetical protein
MSSQITPNNVNQNYPVAGVDNNSQGFRDNFTGIKNNFIVTKREIDDLMNKVVVKEALTYGPPLDNNLNGTSLGNVLLTGTGLGTVSLGTANGAVSVNYINGNYQTITLNGNTTLSFANFPTGNAYSEIQVSTTVANVAHTLSFGGAATYQNTEIIAGFDPSNTTVTFTTPGTYDFVFGSANEGANITVREISTRLLGKYLTSNTAVTSTSLVTTGLGFSTAANVQYAFEAVIPFTHSAAATDTHTFSVQYGSAGAGSGVYTVEQQAGPDSAFSANTAVTSNSTVSTVTTSSTSVKLAKITGVYSHTANSSITITAATSDGTLTVVAGSHVKVTPLV